MLSVRGMANARNKKMSYHILLSGSGRSGFMRSKKIRLSSALAVCFLLGIAPGAYAQAKNADNAKPAAAGSVKNLRRVDFGVQGSTCASCLGRVRKRMKKVPGVINSAVLIKKPFGACALYDGSKVKVDKILKAALEGEKVKVKITDVNDRAITKMPFILVPDINQLLEK